MEHTSYASPTTANPEPKIAGCSSHAAAEVAKIEQFAVISSLTNQVATPDAPAAAAAEAATAVTTLVLLALALPARGAMASQGKRRFHRL
jgi:hypothetical protein